MEPRPKWNKNV